MIRCFAIVLPVLLMFAAAPHLAPPDAGTAKPKDPVRRVATPTKDDLQLRPGALTLITDAPSGQPYWVFTYSVLNTTGRTQRFTPRFELVTGEGIILSAGSDVPPEAQRRLQRVLGKLEAADQFQIMGDVLEGEANAREGFAVWPANKGDAKEMQLYITGLSRAMDREVDPATGKSITLRRVLERRYSLPGVPDPRVVVEAPFISETWVMR